MGVVTCQVDTLASVEIPTGVSLTTPFLSLEVYDESKNSYYFFINSKSRLYYMANFIKELYRHAIEHWCLYCIIYNDCKNVIKIIRYQIKPGRVRVPDKKYYWLKLKNNFFDRKDIKIMEGMENGKDYIIFLLKLKLRSLEDEGYLRISDAIPYDEKMLSTITNTDIDIVRSAMKVFKEFGLIEILEDRTIYMSCIEQLIGSETSGAERVRRFRAKKDRLALQSNQGVTGKKQKGNTELELDKELKLDNKEEPQKAVCRITKLKGTFKKWTVKMCSRYCPDKNEQQCFDWYNEYSKELDIYLVHDKGIVKRNELAEFKKTAKYYPIFENQLKDWMEKDGGMPARIKVFRETIISLEK